MRHGVSLRRVPVQQSYLAADGWPLPTTPVPAAPTTRSLAQQRTLRRALAPFLDLDYLRRLVGQGGDIRRALRQGAADSQEARDLIEVLAMLLRPTARQTIGSPEDAAAMLIVEMATLDQEQLRVVCLDGQNGVQEIALVYQGTIHDSLVRPAEMFAPAIRNKSAKILIAHNHPAGSLDASSSDVELTATLVDLGARLGVEVLDHLIIAYGGAWRSMAEYGQGFPAPAEVSPEEETWTDADSA